MSKRATKVASTLYIAFDFFLIVVFSILFYLSSPMKAEPVVFVPRGSINKIIAEFANKTPKLNAFDGFFLRFLGQPQAGYIALKREFKGFDNVNEAENSESTSKNEIPLIENSQNLKNSQNSVNFFDENASNLNALNGVNSSTANTSNSVNFLDKNATNSVNFSAQNAQKTHANAQNTAISNDFVLLTKADFLYKLTTAKAATTRITLIPGETKAVFFRELASRFKLSEAALNAAYTQLADFEDGLFYPNSFDIPIFITKDETALVKMLLSLSARAFDEFFESEKVAKDERYKLIIKASVIQKEAAADDEMAMVSSVIDNRLKLGMKLQMDGTLNYGLFSHAKITPERIRNDESPYNTYKFSGLPSTAVCNVSITALRAALHPAKSDFLYFMRDKATCKGTSCRHIFTKTINEHNKAIKTQQNP